MPGRKSYAGGAARTTLNGPLTNVATTIVVTSGTGYPTGGTNPFVITIDRGTATEEKVLVQSRSGNTLTVAASGRGYDGTTAVAHSDAAFVEHTLDADSIEEANAHVNDDTRDDHAQYLNATRHADLDHTTSLNDSAIGDLGDVDDTGRATDHVLKWSAGLSNWVSGFISSGSLATDSVGSAQIAANAVGSSEIAADAVGSSELADNAVDTNAIANLAVTAAKIANDTITSTQIAADAVTSSELADNAVTANKILTDAVTTTKITNANVTRAKLEASLPRGTMGYAQITSDSGPHTTMADIPGLSVTFTPVASGRLLKVTVTLQVVLNAAASFRAYVREGSTELGRVAQTENTAASEDETHTGSILVASPTVASHTYKVSVELTSGVANIDVRAGATFPAFILVEDIGAA